MPIDKCEYFEDCLIIGVVFFSLIVDLLYKDLISTDDLITECIFLIILLASSLINAG